jgi:hypothetical protein
LPWAASSAGNLFSIPNKYDIETVTLWPAGLCPLFVYYPDRARKNSCAFNSISRQVFERTPATACPQTAGERADLIKVDYA